MKLSKVMSETATARDEVDLELAVYQPNHESELQRERHYMLRRRIAERLPQLGEKSSQLAVHSSVLEATLRQTELSTEILRMTWRLLQLQRRAYSAISRGEVCEQDTYVAEEVLRPGRSQTYQRLWTELSNLPSAARQDWLNQQFASFTESGILPPVNVTLISKETGVFEISIPLFDDED